MTEQISKTEEFDGELRAAIRRDQFSIFFQPIMDLQTGRIRGFEALIRWFHPERGELAPEEFIPLAEDSGAIITLGNWVAARAARAAAKWPADILLSINLSPKQIRAPGAALGILSAVREAGLNPGRLELEVTEDLFLSRDAVTSHFMENLLDRGVRFALDDFGTGSASLGYIGAFPFHAIKVDRSFVSGPLTGPRESAMIRAVADMGAALGMEIVAEGLETAEQVAAVRNAGCTLGQGYHFSRALPEYAATMLLARERGGAPAAASGH